MIENEGKKKERSRGMNTECFNMNYTTRSDLDVIMSLMILNAVFHI